MIVRELLTRLSFDADESKVKSFDSAVMGLQKSLLAVVGAATAAGAAAFSLASASARYGDEVAKTARQIGISTDALQGYRFAFDRLGVSEGEATSALERFSRSIGRAADGSGTEAEAFEKLSISIRDVDGNLRPMEDLLPDLADALAGVESEAERAAISQDLLGRSGGAMAAALAEGGDEIRSLLGEFEQLGGALSEDQTKAAEEFTDAMTNMRTVLNGIRLQIGAELMPVFRPMIEAITQFIALNRQIILTRAHDFFQMLSDAMGNLMAVAENIIGVLSRVWGAVDNLSGFEKAALAVGLVMTFMRRAWIWASLLFLALEDLGAWMRGEDSLLGDWLGDFDDAVAKVNALVEALGGMENIIRAIIALALLKWIVGVTRAVGKLAAALGFAGVAKAAGAAGAAAGAAWGASFRAAAVGALGRGLGRILGVTALAAAAGAGVSRGATPEMARTPEEIAEFDRRAVERAIKDPSQMDVIVRENLELRGIDPDTPHGRIMADREHDRLFGNLSPLDFMGLGQHGAPDFSGVTDQPESGVSDAIDELGRHLELPDGDAPAPDVDVLQDESGNAGKAFEQLKGILDSLEEMSFDLNAPPELQTLSGDIDNSVTNTSLDFNVTQNITVPAGTTAEQLAVIRSETRRALEREVNNAARTLET